MQINEYATYLRRVLQQELPGKEAHKLMAPLADITERFGTDTSQASKSAVLIMLFPEKEDIHTLLIRRADDGSAHSGQISFPGGKWEAGDPDMKTTALREANEEVGSKPEDLEILGNLSPLFIPVSNFLVEPYVALAKHKPVFLANPAEVAGLISLPLKDILLPGKRGWQIFQVREGMIEAPCFHINGYRIWGATAMILSEFAEVLRSFAQQTNRILRR